MSEEEHDPIDPLTPYRRAEEGILDIALALVRYLRANDPWDARQTPASLAPHLLEEAHETAAAARRGDVPGLREELGDLLLNVAFQIVIAEEREQFGAEDVARTLDAKMRRRHPHLFGQGGSAGWEAARAREREEIDREGEGGDRGGGDREGGDRQGGDRQGGDRQGGDRQGGDREDTGALGGIPEALPPLLAAHRIQQRAAAVGFDWPAVDGALEKLSEEIGELRAAFGGGGSDGGDGGGSDDNGGGGGGDGVLDELGDVLFAAVNVARLAGAHADDVLDAANRKFTGRFEAMERLARGRSIVIGEATLDELDSLWEEVKRSGGE